MRGENRWRIKRSKRLDWRRGLRAHGLELRTEPWVHEEKIMADLEAIAGSLSDLSVMEAEVAEAIRRASTQSPTAANTEQDPCPASAS